MGAAPSLIWAAGMCLGPKWPSGQLLPVCFCATLLNPGGTEGWGIQSWECLPLKRSYLSIRLSRPFRILTSPSSLCHLERCSSHLRDKEGQGAGIPLRCAKLIVHRKKVSVGTSGLGARETWVPILTAPTASMFVSKSLSMPYAPVK